MKDLKKEIIDTISPYINEWLDSSDGGMDADVADLVRNIEQKRDEFAVNLLLHIGNMKLSLGKDDKERREMAQSMIEQYKETL